MTTLLVTGTGPGVGATAVAVAVASLAAGRGTSCTLVVPASTGVDDDAPSPADAALRAAARGVELRELARYPDPLSPAAAARSSGRPALDPAACAAAVLDAGRDAGLVVVLGSGGLLVRYDEDGSTAASLARSLRLPVVLVASVAPGGVNAAALTLDAIAHRGLELVGLVVGSWPDEPGLVERSAVPDLEMLAARPLLGVLPTGVRGPDLAVAARTGLGPALGGAFDATAFRRRVAR